MTRSVIIESAWLKDGVEFTAYHRAELDAIVRASRRDIPGDKYDIWVFDGDDDVCRYRS